MHEEGFRSGVRNHGLVADAEEPVSIVPEKEWSYETIYLWPAIDQMSQMKNLPVFNQWISYDS
jgi:hypothetical protein